MAELKSNILLFINIKTTRIFMRHLKKVKGIFEDEKDTTKS